MLRYYQTTDNLGGETLDSYVYDFAVIMTTTPVKIEVISGYTSISDSVKIARLAISSNIATLTTDGISDGGDTVTITGTGKYIIANSDYSKICIFNVLDFSTSITETNKFYVESVNNELFPPIPTSHVISGGETYRCISLKNESISSFESGKIWIENDVAEGSIEIGFDPCGVNGTATTSTGYSAPIGVTFSTPLDEISGLSIPTLSYNSYIPVWIKRTAVIGQTNTKFRFTLKESGTYV